MRKKNGIVLLVLLLLLFAGGLYIWQNQTYWGLNPFTSFTVSDLSDVCVDNRGNIYVIQDGGYEIVRINNEGKVDLILPGEGDGKTGFFRAVEIALDDMGHLYVHSLTPALEATSFTGAEGILVYNTDGKYSRTIRYEEYEEPVLRPSVLRIQGGEDVFYYIADEDGVGRYDTQNRLVGSAAYDQASTYLCDALWDHHLDIMYLLSMDGRLMEVNWNGTTQLLWEVEENGISSPWSMSIDEDGTLYVCDIGDRTIYAHTEDRWIPYYFNYSYLPQAEEITHEAVLTSYVQYTADVRNGFATVNSDEVIWLDSAEAIQTASSFDFGAKMRVRVLVLWLSILVCCICVLDLLGGGIVWLSRLGTQVSRNSALILYGVVGATILFALVSTQSLEGRILEEIEKRIQQCSDSICYSMPVEEFERLDSVTDFMEEDYQAVRNCVRTLMLDPKGTPGDLYCVLYRVNDDVITSCYQLEGDKGTFYTYDWEYEGSSEQEILTTCEAQLFESVSTSEGNYLLLLSPITNDEGQAVGLIEVGTDLTSFQEENQELLIRQMITIIVMSIVLVMVSVEALLFWENRTKYRLLSERTNGGFRVITQGTMPLQLLRIVVFLVTFITNLTTSFLSIYAVQLAQTVSLLGLPAEILAAVPISAEVLMGALASGVGSGLLRRFGCRWTWLSGGVLFTLGLVLRFLRPDLWLLTLGNGIMGFGWGLILLIVNTAIATQDGEAVEKGFVDYNAGMIMGINCGVVFGGFLVQWLTHTQVFLLAALLSVLVWLFGLFYANNSMLSVHLLNPIESDEKKRQTHFSGLRFLFQPSTFSFFFLIGIPVIAGSYFLNYLYPLMGEQLGMSETYIGYSYLLNGLVVVLLGNYLASELNKRLSLKTVLLLASLLYTVVFLWVGIKQDILSLFGALVLLGVSDSFGYASQTTFYSELPAVRRYGYDRAMGIYSLFENGSQSAGSFLFGALLAFGLRIGLIIYAGVVGVGAGIFWGIVKFLKIDRADE